MPFREGATIPLPTIAATRWLEISPHQGFSGFGIFQIERAARQRCAVFTLREHTSTIRLIWFTIWNKLLPLVQQNEGVKHGCEAVDASDFERYDEEFDERKGMDGGVGADPQAYSIMLN